MDHLIGSLSGGSSLKGMLSQPTIAPLYTGDYVVTPMAHEQQTLQTANKLLTDDVTVKKVPYYETSNDAGGTTIYIASDLEGA